MYSHFVFLQISGKKKTEVFRPGRFGNFFPGKIR